MRYVCATCYQAYTAEIGVPSITNANEKVADQPIVDQANCNQVCVLKQRSITVHPSAPDGTMYSPPQPANSTYIPASTQVSRSNLQCSWCPAAGRSDWLAEGTHSRPWEKDSRYYARAGGRVPVLQGVAEGEEARQRGGGRAEGRGCTGGRRKGRGEGRGWADRGWQGK